MSLKVSGDDQGVSVACNAHVSNRAFGVPKLWLVTGRPLEGARIGVVCDRQQVEVSVRTRAIRRYEHSLLRGIEDDRLGEVVPIVRIVVPFMSRIVVPRLPQHLSVGESKRGCNNVCLIAVW